MVLKRHLQTRNQGEREYCETEPTKSNVVGQNIQPTDNTCNSGCTGQAGDGQGQEQDLDGHWAQHLQQEHVQSHRRMVTAWSQFNTTDHSQMKMATDRTGEG